jgi:hypothetical protein
MLLLPCFQLNQGADETPAAKTDTKLFDYMTGGITMIFSYFPLIVTRCLTMLLFYNYINFSSDAILSNF